MFKHEIGTKVRITCSGEEGVITGRAEHQHLTVHDYHLRYTAGDGRAVTQWWNEDTFTVID